MTDVVTVGSEIEGGALSVDLDEVRATSPADQWKHTDLLCGVIAYLRDELAKTTADLAVACDVARERGEARPADYSPVHLYPVPSPRRPLCGSVGSGRMVARTEGDLRGICVACVDAALARAAGVPARSATNPDGFVTEQIAETTALLRSLWLEHHVMVMKLGGPVTNPAATFDAWLAAVSGGTIARRIGGDLPKPSIARADRPWVEVRCQARDQWQIVHFRTAADAERWALEGLGDWLADVGHIHDPAVCDVEH